MKKIFTLIAAALMAVGVNAQTAQNLFFGGAGTNATIKTHDGSSLPELSHVLNSMEPLICSAENLLFLGMNTRD